MVTPLAPVDGAHTNLSTAISFSIFDRDGNELQLQTTQAHPYRLVIPRDPNLALPPIIEQNVTAMNDTPHQLLFNLHRIDLTAFGDLSVSVHIEVQPMNSSLAYLFVFGFDAAPTTMERWAVFCPSSE